MTQRHSQVVLLTVSQFAKVCNATPRTIRFYEKNGLIVPAQIDENNNYRYYLPSQAKEVFKIRLLQDFGLSLSAIKQAVASDDFKARLERQLHKLSREIQRMRWRKTFLDNIDLLLYDPVEFQTRIKQEEFGPYQLLSLSKPKADYAEIDSYFNELHRLATKLDLKVEDREITFYHDPAFEYKPISTPIETALILKSKAHERGLPEEFCFRHFPKTSALTFTFNGPYTFLPLIFEKMDQWIASNDIKLQGPVFEYYMQSSGTTLYPYRYVTKIAYPV